MAPVTSTAPATARHLAEGAVRWLARWQRADGNLVDPLTGEPLSPHHYAPCLFAAATCLLGDPALRDAGERAVGFYLGLDPRARGAHELNDLGLLQVAREWEREGRPLPDRARLERHLLHMPLASLEGSATNNWHAMRAVCLLERGLLLGRSRDLQAALRCLHGDVLPLQGSGGLFADYPPRPRRGVRATPLTYHAKICAMLAMFLRDLWDDRAARSLRDGVGALACLCGPDGEALYFGRSCNSLYGYAAALYACQEALRLGVVPEGDSERVRAAASRLWGFLLSFRRPDGGLVPYPAPGGPHRRGWDDYVTVPDYAAFSAFLLLQLPEAPAPSGPSSGEWSWEAPDGIAVRSRCGGFWAVSTVGQLDTGSYLFADARYSGMQVLSWKQGGLSLVPPPPHDRDRPTDPGWVGYMPTVAREGDLYAVRVYDRVRVVDGPGYTAVLGEGRPVSLGATAFSRISRRAAPGSRLRASLQAARGLARRLGLPAPPAYRVRPLPGVVVRRALLWWAGPGWLLAVDRVDGAADRAWGNLRTCARPEGRGPRFLLGGGEVRLLGDATGPFDVREVHTSNGPASVVRYPLRPGVASVAALAARGPVEAAYEPTEEGVLLRLPGGRQLAVDLRALEVRE